jgi:hypothetical protein
VSDEKKNEQKVRIRPPELVSHCLANPSPPVGTSDQQTVDAALLSAIKKVDNLGRYLRSEWGLSKGDRIHELKF